MNSKYRLAASAKHELDEILEYVLRESGLDRAAALFEKFDETFLKIAEMPGIGHAYYPSPSRTFRVWSLYSYLIVYRPETRPLEIARIIHGARDLRQLLPEL